jgi:hypothetical protein
VIVPGNSSHATHRAVGFGRRQQARYSPVPPVFVLHVPQQNVRSANCSFGAVRMNAQQMVPGEYWRGPGRRQSIGQ